MNDMNDAQISLKLALAIGWQESDFYQDGDGSYVAVRYVGCWREFDYRSPDVAWAVAERFDCFPSVTPWDDPSKRWSALFDDSLNSGGTEYVEADTAAKAVALAVIAAHGG
jgi:hypothetical protein